MLMRKQHIRGVSRSMTRLMAVLFAVQIVVGGFCLLTAEAHEASQSVASTMQVNGHCAKPMHVSANHKQDSDHSGNCYHCDQPDELSNAAFTSMVPVVLVLSNVIISPVAPPFSRVATGLLSTRTPTGPPRSSSLLYTQTQRIRV